MFLHSFVLLSFCGAGLLPERVVEYQECCLNEEARLTFEHCGKQPQSQYSESSCCKPKVSELKPANFQTIESRKADPHQQPITRLPDAFAFETLESVLRVASYDSSSPPFSSEILVLHSRRNE